MINTLRRVEEQRGIALTVALAIGGASLAGCGGETPSGPGYDISHPQCSEDDQSESIDLPEARSFAIVGLNRGVAKTFNPCFEEQMKWAADSAGDKEHPKASIYINSGNPGKSEAGEWPDSGEFNGETCTGEDTPACAFEYGRSLVQWNIDTFMEEYGEGHEVAPEDFKWWIDVETGNSWQCNKGLSPLCAEENAVAVESGAYTRNAAVITGMVTELQSNGIDVGIYTNRSLWNDIVANIFETLPEHSAVRGLDVWVTNVGNEDIAKAACEQSPFGGLGKIVLSQYYNPERPDILDKNVYCPALQSAE